MATADFPKRFSIGVSEEAHANLRKAADELGVEQNLILTWMLEDLQDVTPFQKRAEEYHASNPTKSMRTIMRKLKTLSDKERKALLRDLQKNKG